MCLIPIFPQGQSKLVDSRLVGNGFTYRTHAVLAIPRHIIPPSSLDNKFIVILPQLPKLCLLWKYKQAWMFNCLTVSASMDVLDECFQLLKKDKYPIIFSL